MHERLRLEIAKCTMVKDQYFRQEAEAAALKAKREARAEKRRQRKEERQRRKQR